MLGRTEFARPYLFIKDRAMPATKLKYCMHLILCTGIWHSIGAEYPIPEEVNNSKIAIRVPVMHEVQFLFASEPCKPLKSRSLYVIFLVEKDMRVKRRRACEYQHHKKIKRQQKISEPSY